MKSFMNVMQNKVSDVLLGWLNVLNLIFVEDTTLRHECIGDFMDFESLQKSWRVDFIVKNFAWATFSKDLYLAHENNYWAASTSDDFNVVHLILYMGDSSSDKDQASIMRMNLFDLIRVVTRFFDVWLGALTLGTRQMIFVRFSFIYIYIYICFSYCFNMKTYWLSIKSLGNRVQQRLEVSSCFNPHAQYVFEVFCFEINKVCKNFVFIFCPILSIQVLNQWALMC